MKTSLIITSSLITVFFAGSGAIIYSQRPVMELREKEAEELVLLNAEEEEKADASIPTTPQQDLSSPQKEDEEENEDKEDDDREEDDDSEDDEETPTTTQTTPTPSTTTTTPTTTTSPSQTPGTYTPTQIASHATEGDCWTYVDKNVYDLTSWVSRHPGGSKTIINMCGKDGTTNFTKKHGGSSSAKAALALLKIGTLAQ